MAKKYTLRAYGPDGDFVFGATLTCADEHAAKTRFEQLPLGENRAELFTGKRLVAVREADEARAIEHSRMQTTRR